MANRLVERIRAGWKAGRGVIVASLLLGDIPATGPERGHRSRPAAAEVLLVLVLIAAFLGVSPSAGVADSGTLEWSAVDRLAGRGSIDELAAPRPLSIRVDAGGHCSRNPSFELDGSALTATRVGVCTFQTAPFVAAKHRLSMSSDGEPLASAEIEPRDLVVASIGDSVASGEGNPEVGSGWLEPRCHRSLRSGADEAARAVERGDLHSVITFVPLACSGATIDTGLLHPYKGIQEDPRKGPLAPQVQLLRQLERPIDALLLSVGANDVNFGALVRFCVFVSDCPNRHFDPRHPEHEASSSAPVAAAEERAALARLGREYDALAEQLDGVVDPRKVIIVEYFDPLRDRSGAICEHALPKVSQDEARWAEQNVLTPLNAQVRAAAQRHGWQLVGGVAAAFQRHGICAGSQSWVRGPFGSAVGEVSLDGTMHPNADGHAATAILIAPLLGATLGVSSGTPELTGPREGYVHWPWLLVAAAAGVVAGAGIALAIRKLVSA